MIIAILNNGILATGEIPQNVRDTPGIMIIDVELPAEFAPATYIWDGQRLVTRPLSTANLPTITMRQAKLQLLALGLYDTVNQAVATMGPAAEIEWTAAAVVAPDNPLVAQVAQMLGWSADETAAYFQAAAER